MLPCLFPLVAVAASGGTTDHLKATMGYDCGVSGALCTIQVEPWGDNSLRVRVAAGSAVLDDAEGALGRSPPARSTAAKRSSSSSLTNGAIEATWSASGALAFFRGGAPLLATAGPLASALRMARVVVAPTPAPPGPPTPGPGPPPFACQDDCALGATGVREHTDAAGPTATFPHSVLANVSRDACCAACRNASACVAWAWGRDGADAAHRHNCYRLASLGGTVARADRDFGCVARPSTPRPATTVAPPPPPPLPPPLPSFEYYATSGAFDSTADEFLTGLGQHSYVKRGKNCSTGKGCGQWKLDQKGFVWPLQVTKFDIMVPFLTSSRRYGLLWNAPGDGEVALNASNVTRWSNTRQRQIDFWVSAAPLDSRTATTTATATAPAATTTTAGRSPSAALLRQYADATGHAPLLPAWATGFWQSKMRYRTPDELLDVAEGYAARGINVSMVVIDFYSWPKFGDFAFDPVCWPNASALTAALRGLNNSGMPGEGVHLLRSTYPWVDVTSANYAEAAAIGALSRDASGAVTHVATGGDAVLDPFSAAARRWVWSKVEPSFFAHGVASYWLDDAEPNIGESSRAGLVYACGAAPYCGALWPNRWVQTFTEGARRAGVAAPLMLSRAGWAGFQATGAVLWSSDIPSTFASLALQVRAGLSAAMSGIPWWTTDIGGFTGGDIGSAAFRELLVRWYQYGAFCPIFRTHGDRTNGTTPMAPLPAVGPRFGEPGAACDAPGGHASGASNEIWEFGEEAYAIIKGVIALRESLRGYVGGLAQRAAAEGEPPMRPLLFDFPDDARSWQVDDQFMFGRDWLVAPVLAAGARNRSVYFPQGATWVHHFTGEAYAGGTRALVPAPLAEFPLFKRSK